MVLIPLGVTALMTGAAEKHNRDAAEVSEEGGRLDVRPGVLVDLPAKNVLGAVGVELPGGIVEGDIIAPERIQLLSTAAVLGDVSTRRLEVAEHVLLHGYCISRKDEAGYEQAEKNRAERKAIAQRSLEQRTGNA